MPDPDRALDGAEETRLAAMVHGLTQKTPRFWARGPAVALATGLAMAGAFLWVVAFGLDEPSADTVATLAPPATEPPTPAAPTTTVEPTTDPPVVITWRRILVPGDGAAEMKSVVELGDGYMAVGWVDSETEGDVAFWLSADGEDWQQVQDDGSLFGGDGFQNSMSVAVNGNRVVLAGLSQLPDSLWAPLVWFSPDLGATWERIELDGYGRVLAVTEFQDGFVAAGDGIWSSKDGRDWTRAAEDAGADNVSGLATSAGRIIAVGSPGDEILSAVWTSSDGGSWERVPHEDDIFGQPRKDDDLYTWWRTVVNAVTWTGSEFVAVGFATTGTQNLDPAAWVSSDGLAWDLIFGAELFNSGDTATLASVAGDGGLVVAVGNRSRAAGSVPLALVSSDGGRTWSVPVHEGGGFDASFAAQAVPNDVIVQGNRIVMVGWAGDSAAVWVGEIGG